MVKPVEQDIYHPPQQHGSYLAILLPRGTLPRRSSHGFKPVSRSQTLDEILSNPLATVTDRAADRETRPLHNIKPLPRDRTPPKMKKNNPLFEAALLPTHRRKQTQPPPLRAAAKQHRRAEAQPAQAQPPQAQPPQAVPLAPQHPRARHPRGRQVDLPWVQG